jgi:hypothetical protein
MSDWGVMRPGSKIVRGSTDRKPWAVQSTWTSRLDIPLIEDDSLLIDLLHPAQAHDPLDLPERVVLRTAHHRPAVHGGPDRAVEPNHLPVVLEAMEEIIDVGGLGQRLDGPPEAPDGPSDQVERLEHPAVREPRLPRPYPADAIRIDAVVEQPAARVHRRLAAAEDRESLRPVGNIHETSDRDEPHPVRARERRRVRRGHLRLGERRVDDRAPDPDRRRLAGEPGHEGVV